MTFSLLMKRSNSLPFSILILGSGLVFVSVSINSLFPMFLLFVITFVSSVLFPIIGISLWVLPAPFEAFAVQQFGISPFVFMTPAVLVGFLFNLVLFRSLRLNISLLFFVGIIMLAGIMSLTFGAHGTGIRNLVSIMLSTLVAFVGVTLVIKRPDMAWIIILGLTISALVAGVYAVINYFGSWRLSLDTGVRELTNPASLSVAALMTVLFLSGLGSRAQGTSYLPIIQKGSPYIIIFLTFIVLATVSRGAILALALAGACMGMLYLLKCFFYWKLSKKALWLIVFAACVIIIVPIIDTYIARGHLVGRMLIVFDEPGVDSRWVIWASAISSLDEIEWLFGAGLGGFRQLSYNEMYPHSVYVGALVEMGMVGLVSILLPMFFALFYGLRSKGIPFVFFWVYMMATFVTHGSLYTKWYYYGIIVAVALAVMVPLKQKITSQSQGPKSHRRRAAQDAAAVDG